MNKLNLLIVAALFVLFALGCSPMKDKGAADAAVAKFHQQLNDQKFAEIYAGADPKFRDSVSEKDFTDLVDAVHRKLGTVKNSSATSFNINATTANGTVVNVGYDVEFSDGKGTEQFAFHIDGDKALLFNYQINSPQLVTR